MEGEVLSLPKLITSGIMDVKLAHCVLKDMGLASLGMSQASLQGKFRTLD